MSFQHIVEAIGELIEKTEEEGTVKGQTVITSEIKAKGEGQKDIEIKEEESVKSNPELEKFLKSYKSLRKTGSDMIRKVAGLEISQVYLSHTPKTLAEKSYTNPHFEKLAAYLELVREQLQPMFDDAPAYGQVYRII